MIFEIEELLLIKYKIIITTKTSMLTNAFECYYHSKEIMKCSLCILIDNKISIILKTRFLYYNVFYLSIHKLSFVLSYLSQHTGQYPKIKVKLENLFS